MDWDFSRLRAIVKSCRCHLLWPIRSDCRVPQWIPSRRLNSVQSFCQFPVFRYPIFSLTLRAHSVSSSTLPSCMSYRWTGASETYASSSSPVASTLGPMLSLLRLLILQQCGKRITVYYYRLKVRRILFTLLFSILIRRFQNIIHHSTSSSNSCDFLCEHVRFRDHSDYLIDWTIVVTSNVPTRQFQSCIFLKKIIQVFSSTRLLVLVRIPSFEP